MIITISGVAGSGKSTVGRMLADRLNYRYFSMGDVRRKMALGRGMNLEEFNKLGERESFTDVEADNYQKNLAKTEDNFIMDGRLSWHFMPNSIKIFLHCDYEEAARRIFNDDSPKRLNQQHVDTVEEQEKLTRDRDESDHVRYKKYYNIDNVSDETHFDLYIDDTNMSPEEVLEKIMEHLRHVKDKERHLLKF